MVSDMEARDLADIMAMEKRIFGKMAWSFQDFASAITGRYDIPLVIRGGGMDGEEVRAYAVLRLLGPEAELENLCVSENYRRMGIASELMDTVIRLAQRNGAEFLYLEVRSQNLGAKELYRKYDFQEQYVRKAYYCDPEDDALIMRKALCKEQ